MANASRDSSFELVLDPRVLQEGERHTLNLILMDRSLSMGRFYDAPLAVLNRHVATIQKKPNAATTSAVIVSFANDTSIVVPHTRLPEIGPVLDYQAKGFTRLHGTVSDVLRTLIPVAKQPELRNRLNVVLAVFTDGEDNPRTNPSELRGQALEAQLLGFKLVLVGIGFNAKRKASEIGFPIDLADNVIPTIEGISQSMARVTGITSMAMACRNSQIN